MVTTPGKPEPSQLIQDWGMFQSWPHRWLRGTPSVRSSSQMLGWSSFSPRMFLREMMNPVCQNLSCLFGNVDLQLLCVDFCPALYCCFNLDLPDSFLICLVLFSTVACFLYDNVQFLYESVLSREDVTGNQHALSTYIRLDLKSHSKFTAIRLGTLLLFQSDIYGMWISDHKTGPMSCPHLYAKSYFTHRTTLPHRGPNCLPHSRLWPPHPILWFLASIKALCCSEKSVVQSQVRAVRPLKHLFPPRCFLLPCSLPRE